MEVSHKKCILLVGGNGFIGSHLINELCLHDYEVRVLSRGTELFRSKQDNVVYFEGDFSDFNVLGKAIDGCDVLVHLAQGSTPIGSRPSPEFAEIEQAGEFARMLAFINQAGLKNIVYFSSGGAVYGTPPSLPVNEMTALNPVSPYGFSKLTMEKYLQMYSYLHDMKYLIIRPSNPYGPRQNFMSKQGVIPIFMKKMLMGETIEIWGDGLATKDYIYIEDFVKAFRGLLDKGLDNKVYIISSGDCYSLNHLLTSIADCTECKPDVVYKPSYKTDVQNISFSSDRLKKRIDWNSETSLDQGLKGTCSWLREIINE